MGRIAVLLIGVGMVGLGIMGTYNAVSDFGKLAVEKTDLSTTGIVTHITATELRHAVGVTLDTTYDFDYSFVAEDGQTYTGQQHNVEAAKVKSLSQGKEITVMYHSDNPNISATPDYGYYVSVDAIPDATPQFRLYFCAGFGILGALVILYAIKYFDEEPQAQFAMQA